MITDQKEIKKLIEEYKIDFQQKTGQRIYFKYARIGNRYKKKKEDLEIIDFWVKVIENHFGTSIRTIRSIKIGGEKRPNREITFLCKWLCYLLRKESLSYAKIGGAINRSRVMCRNYYMEMNELMKTDSSTQIQYYTIMETKKEMMAKELKKIA